MPKFLILIPISILLIIISCSKIRDPYILSHLPNIQLLEKQDHKFCLSLKLDFNESNGLKNSFYWHCRLSSAKYRLYTDTRLPASAKHNLEISDLISKISLKLADTAESPVLRENKRIDNVHHMQCLGMGFEINTEDQIKIDDYFSCRKALIEERKLVPPFGETEYLKYPNNSYNIGFVVDQRVDEQIKRYEVAKEKYPTCVKYHLESKDFKSCTDAQDRSRQCFAGLDKQKFKKELEEKLRCQKLAYLELPDAFLKDQDQKKKDLERMRLKSDYYNQQSFAALGINDITDFDADDNRVIEMKLREIEQKKLPKIINSKNGLYSKFELTQLRQRYIHSCQEEANYNVNEYMEGLRKNCTDMEKFKELATQIE